MKIGIDLSMVDENKAGIGYYASESTRQLILLDKESIFYLYTYNKNLVSSFSQLNNVKVVEIKSNRPNLKWIIKTYIDFKKKKIDYFISPSNFMFGVLFSRTIQIIHDLLPIKRSEFWPKKAGIFYKYQLKLASRRAFGFAVNSEATKNDLNYYFPKTKDKAFYIGGGLNEWAKKNYTNKELEVSKEKLQLPENYFFSAGTLQPRKNYEGMIKAFYEFKKDHSEFKYLISGGKGWYYDHIFKIVKDLKLEDDVIFLGYTDEIDFPALIKFSSGFLWVSHDEGFGMPCLEAYAFGKPILTSDIPVLREVMEENAFFVDPNNISAIVKGMSNILSVGDQKVNKEFLNKHSWKNVAKRLKNIYI
ncbi:MAG: glycosyltransferase family 1 protein [Candidatus Dojkabacteria bacterium]|nr:glycosyltransferase family 1 protein [Candidatus Dojkabacteria bacterium]MDQ7021824.1 glycosyltransferase family 1 protein [Candidatus Dojkabacteria bacterium]